MITYITDIYVLYLGPIILNKICMMTHVPLVGPIITFAERRKLCFHLRSFASLTLFVTVSNITKKKGFHVVFSMGQALDIVLITPWKPYYFLVFGWVCVKWGSWVVPVSFQRLQGYLYSIILSSSHTILTINHCAGLGHKTIICTLAIFFLAGIRSIAIWTKYLHGYILNW